MKRDETSRSARQIMTTIKDDLTRDDFNVVVKRNDLVDPSWRWEIYAAGKAKAVLRADKSYPTMSEATREGRSALRVYLDRVFPASAD